MASRADTQKILDNKCKKTIQGFLEQTREMHSNVRWELVFFDPEKSKCTLSGSTIPIAAR